MDLRTIMNSDAAASSHRAQSPSAHQSPSQQLARKASDPVYPAHEQHASPSSATYASNYPGGPSQQPPPLQRTHTSPDRSSSYGSLQSPYQYQASSSLNASAQSQRGQSPPAPYGSSTSRDSFAAPAGYNHSQQQQQSPIAHQRSQSIQESPSAAAPQPYPPQQFPPPAQGSLPGTPRASIAVPYQHSPPSSARPQSSGHDSLSNRASSPWVGQDAQIHMSPTAVPRAARHGSRPLDQTPRQNSVATERRESDESVSPKTTFAPGSRRQSTASYNDQSAPSQLNHIENGIAVKNTRTSTQNSHPGQPATTSQTSSPSTQGFVANESPKVKRERSLPPKANFSPESSLINSSPQAPKRKRRRFNEPPIYAQRSVRTKGKCPMIPNRFPPIPKHVRDTPQNPWFTRQQVSFQAAPPPVKAKTESPSTNGPPAAATTTTTTTAAAAAATTTTTAAVAVAAPVQQPGTAQLKSLGPWEPSITGFIPHEEVTKLVCDFLFQHVVLRNDAMAGPAGSLSAGSGAIIEVEAKLGHLVDLDRGERLSLPILTESVISRDNPRFRTSFQSNMTQAQHRAMNNFLNEAVRASMPQANPGRIPLSYAHKKERDTFYEVSPSELPPVIRQNLNPRHKPKVRVTVDQRTGEVLAKIVKCRVADLDVHSPRTCVDWRVSVNLEMNYDGDHQHLPLAETGRGSSDRNKDRMSYRHLAYQVDLTQVARSEPSAKGEFEHELEIEVSAAEIRRQGQLAMAGDPKNQYEDLVKGLVDNIRVLARAVPP
ncbi:hypothetical protein P175DRAFT_0497195 [Aspergillus ochraceoroseus IBT 24754]|uniref:mRNA-capping enzyme subunit beta n=1 Tax=Aspergillus ochraceoroseus IBT 24754 TaxID=1392256 RepID=A0A2T5M6C3_9EURO|nr:uncharacterized protein P175DRAFT_0497195 [Aspergillus ochraceoroseus IBT 24754]PTU24082.1 hypothetical protein P175DRAFT_0497195 [Aspergillus ochraceoroseus IBT 24754]